MLMHAKEFVALSVASSRPRCPNSAPTASRSHPAACALKSAARVRRAVGNANMISGR